MKKIREKKIRGRRNKAKRSIKIFEITTEGFWIETYKGKHYISRKVFPWFRDATDDEILDVCIHLDVDDYHRDVLVWTTLNCDVSVHRIDDPSWR
jgi:hypothetical protein